LFPIYMKGGKSRLNSDAHHWSKIINFTYAHSIHLLHAPLQHW